MSDDTKKLAAAMVGQQIGLYDVEINNLEEQIRQLQARREAVQMMRKALLPLAQGAPASPRAGSATITPPTGALGLLATTPVVVTKGVGASGRGFAEAVRDVLRNQPKGATPSDVAAQMKARGTAALYTGKTQFNVRVGNELHRLMKAGEVSRRSGRYYLTQQELQQ